MRISSAALLALAACTDRATQTANTQVLAQVETDTRAQPEDDGHIFCARGTGPLARICTLDRATDPRGLILTVRHPDGGFHRLLVTRDGRGVIAADGPDYAVVTVAVAGGHGIDVAIGGDRYRLPATIKPAS